MRLSVYCASLRPFVCPLPIAASHRRRSCDWDLLLSLFARATDRLRPVIITLVNCRRKKPSGVTARSTGEIAPSSLPCTIYSAVQKQMCSCVMDPTPLTQEGGGGAWEMTESMQMHSRGELSSQKLTNPCGHEPRRHGLSPPQVSVRDVPLAKNPSTGTAQQRLFLVLKVVLHAVVVISEVLRLSTKSRCSRCYRHISSQCECSLRARSCLSSKIVKR